VEPREEEEEDDDDDDDEWRLWKSICIFLHSPVT
jgi:hypothetical protein